LFRTVEQCRCCGGDLLLGGGVFAAAGQQLERVLPCLLTERGRNVACWVQSAVIRPPSWWLRIQTRDTS
jgi:hypothetical protein